MKIVDRKKERFSFSKLIKACRKDPKGILIVGTDEERDHLRAETKDDPIRVYSIWDIVSSKRVYLDFDLTYNLYFSDLDDLLANLFCATPKMATIFGD